MRSGICCIAAVMLIGAGFKSASAELRVFSLPSEEQSWKDAQQGPLSVVRFLEVIDTEREDDAILPIESFEVVFVPPIDVDMPESEYSPDDPDSLFWFSRHITRYAVVAQNQVVLEDENRTIEAGDILIPQWGSFPKRVRDVQILRRAGIEEIVSLRNVAEGHPRPSTPTEFTQAVEEGLNLSLNLTPFGIFETAMRISIKNDNLGYIFDGDPLSSFQRIDRIGQDVTQKWKLYIDLGRYFPVRMVRFYSNPQINLRPAAYTLFEGVPDTERQIAGINLEDPALGSLGFPEFIEIGDTFPTFAELQRVPVNVEDTVVVVFDPPRSRRYARLDFDTGLDYDIGEFEVFADGFVSEATYTTDPQSLPSATLGRIFWEEDWLGDPGRSRVAVSVQSGTTPEPLMLFRINQFEAVVEWKDEGATVVDRRPGSKTFNQTVDLNDPEFNNDARDIFSALPAEERAVVRLSRAEYQALAGPSRSRIEPDLEFWSGFQPVQNGGLLNSPSGKPYFQLKIDFFSDSPEAARIVRNLRFEYSTPQMIDRIVAEIAPAVDVVAGRDTAFVMALKAKLEPENDGFNRLQIFTPARISRVEEFAVDLGDGQVQPFERVAFDDAIVLPGEGQFKEILLDDDQFVVGFPTIRPLETGESREVLLRLRFTGRVIDFRTSFGGNTFLDSLGAERVREYTPNGILARGNEESEPDTVAFFLPQPIEAGDVLNLLETDQLEDRNSLSVIADISSQSKNLVTNLRIRPSPFTPNGDGINDEVVIAYDLQRLLTSRPVHLEIYDLSGRRVKQIERIVPSGGYSQIWDGQDEGGKLVAPGVYVLRISVEADDAGEDQLRLISVVY